MSFWKQFPFIRLTIALLAGILAAFVFQFSANNLIILILYLILFLIIFIFHKKISYKLRFIPGLLIFSLLFFLSLNITDQLYRQNRARNLNHSSNKNFFIADISEPVVVKSKSVKVIFSIKSFKNGDKWEKADGKILAYLKKDHFSVNLLYGDRLIFFCKPFEPAPAIVPGAFDNRNYLAMKGIYLQTYLRENQWKKLAVDEANPVVSLAISWRNRMLEIFRNNGLSGQEFAVAAALLLGYVDEIDQGVIRDYSITGAMHILSVSGMHVGVIFIFLDKLLMFLNRSRKGLLMKNIFIILFIWLYAMITGLSPAVLRAAAMISLVILSKSLRRHPHIFNILGISLFFLLLWSPGLLFDTGFLLSYLAVAGIIILFQPIKDILTPSVKIAEKIWSLVAVSIAAQLSTLPLCFYLFHQFPNYFLLTNIVVVPFSNIIIYTAMLCLFLGGVPVVSVFITKVLFYMVRLMNGAIHFIGSLPYSVTNGISITAGEAIILYLILICFILYFTFRRIRWLYASMILVLMLISGFSFRRFEKIRVKQMVVLSAGRSFIVDCVENGSSIIAGDISFYDDHFFCRNLNAFHLKSGAENKINLLIDKNVNNDNVFRYGDFIKSEHFIQFGERRIMILGKSLKGELKSASKCDLIILTGNPKIELKVLLKSIKTPVIAADGSNSGWKSRKWKAEADSAGVEFQSLREKKAIFLDF